MSQMQQQQQNEQTITACKNNKRKNRKKHAKAGEVSVNCEPPNNPVVKTKPNENKHLQQTSVEQTIQKPIVSRKAAGSNWESVATANNPHTKQNANEQENIAGKVEEKTLTKSARLRLKRRAAEQKYVAIDCEMVGVGVNGQDDMLARVSIVSKRGAVLLDKFVKPQTAVTDYRTKISGIRPHDIANGEDFKSVQDEVVEMLKGKILIGHAIVKDLTVLRIRHPLSCIRDTSRYKPLRHLVSNGHTPSLKRLTQAVLGKEIQTGEHNSVEDARAAMSIYNLLAKDWEAYLRARQQKAGQ